MQYVQYTQSLAHPHTNSYSKLISTLWFVLHVLMLIIHVADIEVHMYFRVIYRVYIEGRDIIG